MRNRRANISEAIGTDAFLDIVANLVGILLILIMVIGVRMDDASDQTAETVAEQAVPLAGSPPSPDPAQPLPPADEATNIAAEDVAIAPPVASATDESEPASDSDSETSPESDVAAVAEVAQTDDASTPAENLFGPLDELVNQESSTDTQETATAPEPDTGTDTNSQTAAAEAEAEAETNSETVVGPSAAEQLAAIEVPDVEFAQRELAQVEKGVRAAARQTKELEQQTELQKLERDRLMLVLSQAELELKKRRESLDAKQREKLNRDVQLTSAQRDVQALQEQLQATRSAAQQRNTKELKHVGTPLAKAVFVREEHFRLQGGLVQFVPLNEMTKQLRSEAPKKMWKLESAPQVTETIGPRDGYQLRYTLRRNRVPLRTEGGQTAVREVVELDRFVMVPVGTERGETLDQALQPGSQLRQRLDSWDPRETVVTIWTYPDSFGEFRQLKASLYELGFLTAARPLPHNQLISGSPQGTRSAAQ